MKKFSLIMIALTGVLTLQSCHYYRYEPRPRYPHPQPRPYPDHDRGRHRGHYPPGRWEGCRRHVCPRIVDSNGVELNVAQILAQDYGIKEDSAKKILTFAGDQRDSAAIEALGIGVDEAAALLKLESPNRESIEKIAQRLGEEPAKVETLVSDFIQDAKTSQTEE